jgi:hypothetical protein
MFFPRGGKLFTNWSKQAPKVIAVRVSGKLSTLCSKPLPNVNDLNVFGKPKPDR